jgi:5'-3' exonuclease
MVSFGVEDFVKRFGALKPSQFVDVAALSGDKADNIPGNLLLLLCPMVCTFFPNV